MKLKVRCFPVKCFSRPEGLHIDTAISFAIVFTVIVMIRIATDLDTTHYESPMTHVRILYWTNLKFEYGVAALVFWEFFGTVTCCMITKLKPLTCFFKDSVGRSIFGSACGFVIGNIAA